MRAGRWSGAGRSAGLCLVAWAASAAAQDGAEGAAASPVPTGVYELEARVGDRAMPVRLELLAIDGRPWGRLSVPGPGVVVAVRGAALVDDSWSFAVGGPVRAMRLRFTDGVTGTIELGGGRPIPLAGRRTGDVPPGRELRAHHVLDPLGLAARAGEEGASFPSGTPDGALIFARHGPDLSRQTLMLARPSTDGWQDPGVLPWSGVHSDRSPAVVPDGSAIIFASDRPAAAGDESERYRLWLAARTAPDRWGAPTRVVFEGGWEHDARQPSVTADGRLYFSSDAPGGSGEGDIYVAEPLAPGRWSAPLNLGSPVNGPDDEHGAWVAPDGSYMILVSAGGRPGHLGGDDLYISERTGDGWSQPEALPLPVNTFANEYGPWVSPVDGELYFTSDRYGFADIFRVDRGFASDVRAPQGRTGLAAWGTEAVGGALGSVAGLAVYLLTASDPEGCDDYGCYFRELGGMLALGSAGSAAGAWLLGRSADTEPSAVGAALGSVAGAALGLLALKGMEELDPSGGDEGASGVLTFTISQGAVTALGSRIVAGLH